MKRMLGTVSLLLVVTTLSAAAFLRRGADRPEIVSQPVTRGSIVNVVAATGTLEPVTTVQVGTQVSGTVESLAADFNSIVRKGQVLLRQSEPASTFYLIERGYLKLTQVTAEGSEVIIRFVGPWDPVGGVAALGEAPYPVTATAVDVVEVRP